jgi:predicted RNA-binding protein with RPS1 domain
MSNIINWRQQIPEPDKLALTTRYALLAAQSQAIRMRAQEILPEHILLGLIKQNDGRVAQMAIALNLDLTTIHMHSYLYSEHPFLQRRSQSDFFQYYLVAERRAYQEWQLQRREELLEELQSGEIRRGVVSNIASFGLFVDLGGVEGLVHVSQLSWNPIKHPAELFKIGQEVEVQVLSVDKEKKKIALSIKRAQTDPWKTVEERYKVGQIVTGTITRIAPFGVFARIEDGIEGLIHLSELAPGIVPGNNLHEGQQLRMRILRLDPARRRLGLSLRQVSEVDVEDEPEEAEEKNRIEDDALSPFEDTLRSLESTTIAGIEEKSQNLPFSQESLQCLDWAISFANQIHSMLVYPDHLLLSTLLQKRIQAYLAPLLPSSEALLAYFTGEKRHDEETASAQASTCPTCKQSTLPGWKHCVYCGASLTKVCPKCGAPYPEIEGARFCFECGGELE